MTCSIEDLEWLLITGEKVNEPVKESSLWASIAQSSDFARIVELPKALLLKVPSTEPCLDSILEAFNDCKKWSEEDQFQVLCFSA